MSSKSVMSSRAVSPAAVCGRPRAARAAAAPAAPAFLSGSRLRSPHLMGTAQGAAPKRQVVRMGLFGLGLPEIGKPCSRDVMVVLCCAVRYRSCSGCGAFPQSQPLCRSGRMDISHHTCSENPPARPTLTRMHSDDVRVGPQLWSQAWLLFCLDPASCRSSGRG